MASFNLQNFDAAMKHMYPYKKVENLVYKNNPLLSMIPKETKFPGRNVTYAVEYGLTTGRSATFATAQANRGGTKLHDFVVTRVKDYAVVTVDNESMLAADGNEGSLLDMAKAKTDSALHALARAMGRDVYGAGAGAIGSVRAGASKGDTTLELTLGDGVNFEVGMRIVFAETDLTALRPGVLTITGIDRVADTITVDRVATAAVPAIADGDKIYPEGDRPAGAAPATSKLSGLDAWLPATVPDAAFFGVTRNDDSTRLGGQRVAFDGSIQETLINAAVRVSREGGRPDAIFMNPLDWAKLAIDLEGRSIVTGAVQTGRRRYGSKDTEAKFGFASLELASPAGMVSVYADHNCPLNLCYMLQMDTWVLKTIGAAPRILDFDGLKGVREANNDGVEYRWGYYGNMLCKSPAYNARIALVAE
jgi:hypothetical protein|tara:strand:+ start:6168 stop:7427 length:1260 start_codon:yes stop_codon:yes gene_type:complete